MTSWLEEVREQPVMSSLLDQTACELRQHVQGGQLSAREVSGAFCDRIEAVDARIGAFLHFDRQRVLAQADGIDAKRRRGDPLGRLAGLPVAIKDNLCVRGEPATCASRILEGFIPPYDAHVIRRLREEDAILVGRANMDEFAMGSSTENSAFRITRNPWNPERVPGGSSGGSAAAVAAREVPLALGSDTGGSIRQPAGACGVVGCKPSYGRVSRFGLVAFASSLDQIGPLARTVEDAALLLEVIAGHDPRDNTCAAREVPAYRPIAGTSLAGLRIGIVPEHFGPGVDPCVREAVQAAIGVLQRAGATVIEVGMPHSRYAIATYYLVATAEASSNLARYDGVHFGVRATEFTDLVHMYSATRGRHFGAEVKRRIMLGTFALSAGYRDAYYLKALKVRRLIKQDYDQAFEKVDVIAGPVSPHAAFRIGEKTQDPLAMYLSDIYTVSANLAGVCGLSVPCGVSNEGLPIGLQIQGAPFAEDRILAVGMAYQALSDWHTRQPPS